MAGPGIPAYFISNIVCINENPHHHHDRRRIHRRAKRIARKRNTTVSALIESLLAREADDSAEDLVKSMPGIAQLGESEPGADPLFDSVE